VLFSSFCAPFWLGAWPVVPFWSDFCAPLEFWLLDDDDWLLDEDELLSDFTLTLPSNPSAVTVRVSMRPLASKPSLRWKAISARTGPGVEHAGDTPVQMASPDEHGLDLADLRPR